MRLVVWCKHNELLFFFRQLLCFMDVQAQSAAHVRGALRAPFALKDATSVSIVSQSAGGVLSDAAIARVISTTTSLTPAQLVVTQQKPGIVGVSTVPQGLHTITILSTIVHLHNYCVKKR